MKREELFHKTVNTLVTAYFNDELEKGNCRTCAVGNICGKVGEWRARFYTRDGQQLFNTSHPLFEIADKLIESTGYTMQELARIEFAFETAEEIDGKNSIQSQFNGLMAVMDILFDIHEVEQGQEKYKELFNGKVCV